MKNKGMHQQPHAYNPSTGGANQGKPMPRPEGTGGQHSHGHQLPQSWQKPSSPTTQSSSTPATAGSKDSRKGFQKGKKAA